MQQPGGDVGRRMVVARLNCSRMGVESRTTVESKSNRSCNHLFTGSPCRVNKASSTVPRVQPLSAAKLDREGAQIPRPTDDLPVLSACMDTQRLAARRVTDSYNIIIHVMSGLPVTHRDAALTCELDCLMAGCYNGID